MPDKRFLPFCVLLGAALFIAPVADAAHSFRLGVQAGMNSWSEDLSTVVPGIEDQSLGGDEAGVGVVAQYVVQAEADTGFFVGFEAAVAQENFSDTATIAFGDFGADVTGEIVRSADLLWFGGYDFGKVSAFFAAGPSIASGEGEIAFGPVMLRDENTHIGWKYGPGVEVDLGYSVSLVARATIGSYRNRAYTAEGFPIAVDVEPRVTEVRVGLVYRFNAGDLFGVFRQ